MTDVKMRKTCRGKLEVIFGPMFSGKTSELIRRIQRYNLAGYKCVVIRYTHDNRYCEDSIITHDGFALRAVTTTRLQLINEVTKDYDVIGIDEGQFFPDILEYCETQSDSGKKVVVAGLDGTFQRVPFGNILQLIPIAENITKLNSICMSCLSEAPFTKRLGNQTEVEVIGGADMYMSVCKSCYDKPSPAWSSPFKNTPVVTKTVAMELL